MVEKKRRKGNPLNTCILNFTPTCTLKAESFGHLISTEKNNNWVVNWCYK